MVGSRKVRVCVGGGMYFIGVFYDFTRGLEQYEGHLDFFFLPYKCTSVCQKGEAPTQ